MAIPTKLLRMQIAFFKPFADGCTVTAARAAQAKLGSLMAVSKKAKVVYSPADFKNFKGEWVEPKTLRSDGVILYLHGGGYTSGDLEYARGFGTVLCAKYGIKVFSAAYRLAPEYPFPAALEDALEAYKFLLDFGYESSKIIFFGDSAGGGLIYCLCLKLKELGMPMPGGLIAVSPWTDLTLSAKSYEENREIDPSMSKQRLENYVSLYTTDPKNPLVSPLYGDLRGLPPSLIFVGSDEVMRDDAVMLHEKLIKEGCKSEITVSPGMWHVYLLFGTKESKEDYIKISRFISEVMIERSM